jgi:hypothetical protein
MGAGGSGRDVEKLGDLDVGDGCRRRWSSPLPSPYIVVDDLAAGTAFFVELGLELEGETTVEGRWADRVVGLDDVRVAVAMMRTTVGHGRPELMKFHTPTAVS